MNHAPSVRLAKTKSPKAFLAEIGRAILGGVLFSLPLLGVLYVGKEPIESVTGKGTYDIYLDIAAVLVWIAGAWVATTLFSVILWDLFFERRKAIAIPKLLRAVASVVLYVSACLLMLHMQFHVDLTGMLAATGILGLVLGFALKSTISDIFAGLSINIERPFKLGDVIEVPDFGAGTVVDINWRSTRIETWDRETVIIPNEVLTTATFKNLSRPDEALRMNVYFHLDYAVPTERARRIFLAALDEMDLGIPGKPPEVHIDDIDELGVRYRVWAFAPDYNLTPDTKTEMIARIMKNLYQAGIEPVHRKLDLYTTKMPKRDFSETKDASELISRMELFAGLTTTEINQLASFITAKTIPLQRDIVKQGEGGDSLFLVVEGLLAVRIKQETRRGISEELVVGKLRAGEAFGEMSLLTGEPRSATVTTVTESVVYEIRRDYLGPILEERPEIADSLSRYLVRRQLQRDEVFTNLDEEHAKAEEERMANTLRTRILKFCGDIGTAFKSRSMKITAKSSSE